VVKRRAEEIVIVGSWSEKNVIVLVIVGIASR
jgi:hypothetical protein